MRIQFGVTAPGKNKDGSWLLFWPSPIHQRGGGKGRPEALVLYSIHYLLNTNSVPGTLPSALEDSWMMGRVAGQRRWAKNMPILEKENMCWGAGRVLRTKRSHLPSKANRISSKKDNIWPDLEMQVDYQQAGTKGKPPLLMGGKQLK